MLVRGSFIRSVSLRNNGPHVFFLFDGRQIRSSIQCGTHGDTTAVDHVINKLDRLINCQSHFRFPSTDHVLTRTAL